MSIVLHICNIFYIFLLKFKSRFMTIPHLNIRHSSGQFKLRNYLPITSFTCISKVRVNE